MGFMSPDSAFMRGLSNTVDAIWINLLMIITSIPLITIGAALTAGHDAARRVAIAEGHVTANYFKAFRANFLKATDYGLFSAPRELVSCIHGWCCRSRRCSSPKSV